MDTQQHGRHVAAVCSILTLSKPIKHIIGLVMDGFLRVNSVKVLKEDRVLRIDFYSHQVPCYNDTTHMQHTCNNKTNMILVQ